MPTDADNRPDQTPAIHRVIRAAAELAALAARYRPLGIPVSLCGRCERPQVHTHHTTRGDRRHQGRGLCVSCYAITRRRPVAGCAVRAGGRRELVDPIAVERAAAGRELVTLRTVERAAAVARCRAAGLSAAETARRLGISERHVIRLRAAS